MQEAKLKRLVKAGSIVKDFEPSQSDSNNTEEKKQQNAIITIVYIYYMSR